MSVNSSTDLTGEVRYRLQRGLFGKSKVIVQVQVRYTGWYGGGLTTFTGWRDAREQDLKSSLLDRPLTHG